LKAIISEKKSILALLKKDVVGTGMCKYFAVDFVIVVFLWILFIGIWSHFSESLPVTVGGSRSNNSKPVAIVIETFFLDLIPNLSFV
jgi:hypothetical protein